MKIDDLLAINLPFKANFQQVFIDGGLSDISIKISASEHFRGSFYGRKIYDFFECCF